MLGKAELESAISALDATAGRIDFALLIFTIIVAVGVAGEAVFGVWHLLVANRVSPLRAQLAQANALEIAQLDKENLVLQERITQLRTDMGPRRLDMDLLKKASEGVTAHPPVEIFFDDRAFDGQLLAFQLSAGLRTLGWQATLPAPVPPDPTPPPKLAHSISSLPKHFLLGMQAWGISVLSRDKSGEIATARDELATMLGRSILPGGQITIDSNEYVPTGAIRVLIGPAPH